MLADLLESGVIEELDADVMKLIEDVTADIEVDVVGFDFDNDLAPLTF